jgi:hypothetical protein
VKKVLSAALAVLFCSMIALSQSALKFADTRITDEGWGDVKIGMSLSEAENILGKPDKSSEVATTIFTDYDPYDVTFVGSTETNKITAIYIVFWRASKTARLKTDKDIGINSTEEDVLKSYGEPVKIKETQVSRTLYYKGISFEFRRFGLFVILVQDKKEIKLT